VECVRVAGVDGKRLDAERVKEVANTACEWACTPGMVGCGASHINIWKRVVEENMPYAIVLEDDALLAPDFVEVAKAALRDVPDDYHLLLLGCFNCSEASQALIRGARDALRSTPAPKRPAPSGLREIVMFSGTHAYVVSRSGAQFLLASRGGKVSYHIDFQMATTPGLKMWGLNSDIARQEDMSTSLTASFGYPRAMNEA
jgi:glycosyl transferase family 25